MERIYTIEDAKAKMQKSVEYYACRIEAWKKVERLYKKDGKPFAVLSKNFNNLTLMNRFGSNEAVVYFKDESGRYENDYINLEANCYTKEEAADTPEAIEKRITALIEKYEAWKKKNEKGLAEIESQLEAINPALEALKQAIAEAKETNTHYTMQSYIKEYLRIL